MLARHWRGICTALDRHPVWHGACARLEKTQRLGSYSFSKSKLLRKQRIAKYPQQSQRFSNLRKQRTFKALRPKFKFPFLTLPFITSSIRFGPGKGCVWWGLLCLSPFFLLSLPVSLALVFPGGAFSSSCFFNLFFSLAQSIYTHKEQL